MSMTSCFLLLLLCLSLHACNARRLAAADSKNLYKKFHISNQYKAASFSQNGKEKVIVAEKIESSSSSNKTTATKEEHQLDDNSQMLKGLKARKKITMAEKNDVKKESHVSVSWRVPRNKPREKHPGFNLDYSPPKTHPPSHNR